METLHLPLGYAECHHSFAKIAAVEPNLPLNGGVEKT